jgi:hypothetical protein
LRDRHELVRVIDQLITIFPCVAQPADDCFVRSAVAQRRDAAGMSGFAGALDFLRCFRLPYKIRVIVEMVERREKVRGFAFRQPARQAATLLCVEWPRCVAVKFFNGI